MQFTSSSLHRSLQGDSVLQQSHQTINLILTTTTFYIITILKVALSLANRALTIPELALLCASLVSCPLQPSPIMKAAFKAMADQPSGVQISALSLLVNVKNESITL